MVKKVSKEEMQVLPYIIAVDFDGTLVEDKFPAIGEKRQHVWDDLEKARANGAAIILWTCRDGHNLEDAVAFCDWEGLKFDAINTNIPATQDLFNNDTRKVYANEYWDDKSISAYCIHHKTEHIRNTPIGEDQGLLEAAKPLIEWLSKFRNPHDIVTVNDYSAMLYQGERGVKYEQN